MKGDGDGDKKKGKWKIEGYDTFEGGTEAFYSFPGKWDTEKEAIEAAKKRLQELEISQPSSQSGGQGFYGIQDQVFIVRPDGTEYRFCG